jgi:hypothetical protein
VVPGSIVHLVFTFKLGNGETAVIGDEPAQPVDAPVAPPTTPGVRVPITLAPTRE